MDAKELHQTMSMCHPNNWVITNPEIRATILRALSLLASVEGSSDEVVRELQRVVLPSLRDYGQGYSAAVAERAAAHILALRKWKDEILVAAGAQENDDVAKWITADKSERDTLRAELASVRAALKLANDSCRSAYQVAARRGIETNWDALQFSLQASLREQHKVMFPEQYTEDRRIRAHDSASHPKDAQ